MLPATLTARIKWLWSRSSSQNFVSGTFNVVRDDPQFYKTVLFSIEALFKLNERIIWHNCVFWATENLHATIEEELNARGWWSGGIHAGDLVGLYFFNGKVNPLVGYSSNIALICTWFVGVFSYYRSLFPYYRSLFSSFCSLFAMHKSINWLMPASIYDIWYHWQLKSYL